MCCETCIRPTALRLGIGRRAFFLRPAALLHSLTAGTFRASATVPVSVNAIVDQGGSECRRPIRDRGGGSDPAEQARLCCGPVHKVYRDCAPLGLALRATFGRLDTLCARCLALRRRIRTGPTTSARGSTRPQAAGRSGCGGVSRPIFRALFCCVLNSPALAVLFCAAYVL